jgi:hypothetical protein
MKSRISYSLARLLQQMVLGEELNYSQFGSGANRKLVDQLIADHALDYRLVGRQQKKVYCQHADNLRLYLHHKFEIPSLENYVHFLEQEETTRADAVIAASDSKFKKTNVFSGFLVNSYEPLACTLDGVPYTVQPIAGVFPFIVLWATFSIPADVTVVVVEGHENFKELQRQRYLFKTLKPLFVWRYQNSNAIASWLNTIPNPYVHFGDFDLKGIHIYLSEFKNKINGNRGRFLLPENLEQLLNQYGKDELFEKQKHLVNTIEAQLTDELTFLFSLILKYKKGLEQEVFIEIPE